MKGLRPVETWERKSLGRGGDVHKWNNLGDRTSPLFTHALLMFPKPQAPPMNLLTHLHKGEILRIHELE